MTTTEHAAEIRADLKRAGMTSRDVSVRKESYSMGSSIYVTAKNPRVRLDEVRAIAEPHERIRYCQATGEILGGGNMYMHVEYDREALAPLVAYVDRLCSAAETLLSGEVMILGLSIYPDADGSGDWWIVGPGDDVGRRANGRGWAAESAVKRLCAEGRGAELMTLAGL